MLPKVASFVVLGGDKRFLSSPPQDAAMLDVDQDDHDVDPKETIPPGLSPRRPVLSPRGAPMREVVAFDESVEEPQHKLAAHS